MGVATAVRNVEIMLELAVTDGETPFATLNKLDNGWASFVAFSWCFPYPGTKRQRMRSASSLVSVKDPAVH